MAAVNRYEDLIAWQKSYALVLRVYRLTKDFPGDERFGLTSQLRRAAVSIPSNIAEGYGRRSRQDYLRFLCIALGSTYEIQTQVRIAKDLGYHTDTTIDDEIAELERVLNGLIRSLRNKENS